MKYCDKCKIELIGTQQFCPLCQCELLAKDNQEEALFPIIDEQMEKRHLLLKIVGFISVVISIAAIFLNILFPTVTWWALVVVLTTGCVWVSLLVAVTKHRNILKYLLYQSVILCLFALFLDYVTGAHGWAITFVVPIVFTLAMIVMYLLSKILNLQVGDYMIYLLLDALFGIIPVGFMAAGRLQSNIPSSICILVSLTSVVALIVFEGKNMFSELKRRLHV